MFRRVLRVFLDEIHAIGTKLIYKHVWVVKVRENIPKDYPRVLEEGPKVGAKTAQDIPTNDWKSMPSGSVDPPLVVSHFFRLSMHRGETKGQSQNQITDG